jgi:death-on-curing protein
MEVVWLSPEKVQQLNRIALYEGETHALNPGSDLEGALNRPRGHYQFGGVESLCELAAMHAVAITKAHAFQDGNKRTAILTVRAFLRANGMDFDFGPHDDEAVKMMESIATGDVDRAEITEWIRRNTVGASD